MKVVFAYLRLYRIDAFAITLLSYISPLLILKKGLFAQDVIYAFMISGISINSVYSLNSWFDRDIDAVNKPERPIPSGVISAQSALIYSALLTIAASVYPFFLNIPLLSKLLFITIPFCGVLYSNPVFPFKKKMILSVFVTSYLMVVPVAIGFTINHFMESNFYVPVYLFMYCLAVIPLKDIEDIQGDVMHGSQNWSDRIGDKKLFKVSAAILFLVAASSFIFITDPIYRFFLFAFCFNTALFILITALFMGILPGKIYKMIIRFNIVQGAVLLLGYKLIL